MSFPKKAVLKNLVRVIISVSALQIIGQTFYFLDGIRSLRLEPNLKVFFLLLNAWFQGSRISDGAWFPLTLILLGIIALAQLADHHELRVM